MRKTTFFKTLILAFAILVGSVSAWGQTRSFLGLDGGLEGTATVDNSAAYTSAQSGKWAHSTANVSIASESSIVRSGSKSIKVTSTSTTLGRLYSPSLTMTASTTKWVFQYYRYSTSTNIVNQSEVNRNGSAVQNSSYTAVTTTGTWEKVSYAPTSVTSATAGNIAALIKLLAAGSNDIYFDDFALYESSTGVDNTVPDAPTTPIVGSATTTTLGVSWSAPGTGVDGGGYLVVRGTSDPVTAPKVNGIYAVGNTIASGMTVVYQGTGTSFTDTGLTTGNTYYYRIYTYDKAYNYSLALSSNGTTSGGATPTISISPSTLIGFTYNYGSGPSAEKTFTVGGSNLTNDISIAAPTDYEISTGTGASFSATSPITILMANAGTPTTIYARLKAGLAVASYNLENIALTSTGATAQNVACSGSVACVSSGIAFASPTINKLVGDAAFTVTATSSSAGAITYSSSVPAVATVDAATGLVTVLTSGTTVITASQVANAGYCANTATYTLNVNPNTPTITVTEVTVPAMAAYVGATNTQVVNVSGINLTSNISLAISGTDAALFTLSSYSVAQSSGTAANTAITITYSPLATGSHTATLTLSSTGASDVTRSLSGTATWTPLATPVATTASAIFNSGFTANWEAVPGATGYSLNVYTKTGGGTPTNVLSENFNLFTGGSIATPGTEVTTFDTYTQTAGWAGTKVYPAAGIVKLGSSSALGSLTTPSIDLSANGGAFNVSFKSMAWLADSTKIKLYLNDVLVKTVTGLTNDASNTLNPFSVDLTGGTATSKVRFEGLQAAKGRFFLEDIVITKGGGTVSTAITGSPFTIAAGTLSYDLSGLQGGRDHFYTITASNTNVTSAVSNEVQVSTLSTGVSSLTNSLTVSASDGIIRFTAESGQVMELYNAVGQKLLVKQTISGMNTIPVASKGLVIVKVGNQIAKVVL